MKCRVNFSRLKIAKHLTISEKKAAIKSITSFSLSWQKQIRNQNISSDREINRACQELKFRTHFRHGGITIIKVFATITLIFLFVLLPFLKRKLTDFWSNRCPKNQIDAQKDTYYRFINQERFNWRKFVYFLALKVIAHSDDTPLKEKVLIADDSISCKTVKNIELVSYHFDHKVQRSILGKCYLQLGTHDGKNFFPVDVAFNSSLKWPNDRLRDIGKRNCAWKRRQGPSIRKPPIFSRWLTGHGTRALMPALSCSTTGCK